MESIGNGVKVQGTVGSRSMAASLQTSVKRDKRPTDPIANLTPEMALEILQQSILNCQKLGLNFELKFNAERSVTLLVLHGVGVSDENLIFLPG